MDNKLYPIDILTFINKDNELPTYLNQSLYNTSSQGFYTLKITPDDYDIKSYHCGFKHIRDITIPKIEKIKDNIKGFFIGEGDLLINKSFYFNDFIEMNITKPTWLGYKKKISVKAQNNKTNNAQIIVGNFLIYIPITYLLEFKQKVMAEKRLLFSDRFFTKLVKSGWLDITNKSYATEIEHYSNILKNIRK